MIKSLRRFAVVLFASLFLLLALIFSVFSFTDLVPNDIQRYIKDVLMLRASPTLDRTPGELIRHARQRLAGHPKLEFIALPVLDFVQPFYERPVPSSMLPILGKGWNSQARMESERADFRIASVAELQGAMKQAVAGQRIEILPGTYRVNAILGVNNPGSAEKPILVFASQAGSVLIEVVVSEAFQLNQPYWHFENLHIRGVCDNHDYCEHAFHVTGKARNFILRNNLIEDFAAHVKVNGYRDDWPDDGLIELNTLRNSGPRHTQRPVTPIDIVGASRWRVQDNYVANFAKSDPRTSSFGIFMKGAGFGGRIERNLVVCSTSEISAPGTRVGISFGGGESGQEYCRDRQCVTEHEGGRAINNIVAHCNDMGIDINRSANSFVAHNTLINTGGIDVRGEKSSAMLFGNLYEGLVRARKGGSLREEFSERRSMSEVFRNPDALDLSWATRPDRIPRHKHVADDFCRKSRAEGTQPGALEDGSAC